MKTGTYVEYKEKTRGTTIWDRLNPMRYTQKISLHRAQILTDAYKEFEGYSFNRKRGYAIRKVLNEMPIYIDDDQLLCGDFCAKPMGPEWHPDLAGTWLGDYADKYGTKGNGTFFQFENDEEAQQARDLADFWRKIGGKEIWQMYLGPHEAKFEHDIGEAGSWLINTVSEMFAEKCWTVPDIGPRIIKGGIRDILRQVEEARQGFMCITDDDYRAHEFWIGLEEMLHGIIEYANRYADLCTKLAGECPNPKRKAELEEMARVCRKVPEHPAETFQEALQSFFFGILFVYYDTRTYGMGFGRVDQFLYPGYCKSKAEGMDDEYALQLLECFRVKVMGKRQFWPDVMVPNLTAESHFHNCILGGVHPHNGADATNELSFLWVKAATRVRTTHPTLSVRWHPTIDRKFMDYSLEVVAMGMGFPAFFNDQSSIQYLLSRGFNLQQARNYAIGGCVLHTVPGTQSVVWPLVMNCGKMMELTIHDGLDTILNKQWGPKTGGLKNMKTFDEFLAAYTAVWTHWASVATMSGRQCRLQHLESFPDIAISAFTDGCIKRGKVCSIGGAAYDVNCQYIVPVGVQDVGNDLYALKYHVFCDNPLCTPAELQDALIKNWEGYEELRAKMVALPKYGNDIPEVDEMLNLSYQVCKDVWFKQPANYAGHYEVAPHSIGFHVGCGAKCGALPSGRIAKVAMADGAVSPVQGTDVSGPSALINSAGRIDQVELYGVLFNMRFTPQSLKSEGGRANLRALIKTYFGDYNGKHIQFNVISREMMLAAKKEPEKHRDLIVRVAGYSAYWADLNSIAHDELILRSENEWEL